MKKAFSLFIIIIACFSCGEDIKRNDVSVFQGLKDNVSWTGSDAKAAVSGSAITIQSVTLLETVTLKVPVPPSPIDPREPSTYVTYALGESNSRTATYTLKTAGGDFEYETGTQGDGEIVITDYNGATISGTFRFNAVNTDGDAPEPIVNFQKGVFYKVNMVPSL